MPIVTGARLATGGLHLGHYVGCFTPLNTLEGDVVFIIGDRANTNVEFDAPNLIAMIADVKAAAGERLVRVTRQTSLHAAYEEVLHDVEGMVTFRQLQAAHPAKHRLRDGTFDGSVKAFLFPLDSACSYLVLDAVAVVMNDDNKRIVTLTQHIAKRMNNTAGHDIVVIPQLVHGRVPRIIGYNYKKMAKGNANAIFLTDDDATIARKAEDLLSLRFLLKTSPDLRHTYYASPDKFLLPLSYAPFATLRALGHEEEVIESLRSIRVRAKLRTLLVQTLIDAIAPVRERSVRLRQAPDELIAHLQSEQEIVCAYAARRAAAIRNRASRS